MSVCLFFSPEPPDASRRPLAHFGSIMPKSVDEYSGEDSHSRTQQMNRRKPSASSIPHNTLGFVKFIHYYYPTPIVENVANGDGTSIAYCLIHSTQCSGILHTVFYVYYRSYISILLVLH